MGFIGQGLGYVLSIVFNMIELLVIASVIISWVGADSNNQIVRMIHMCTEPMYRPMRRFTSKIPGPIDWAPMVIILVVIFLQRSLVPYLMAMGRGI